MVDKLACGVEGVEHVVVRRELVRMPCEVDVEGGNCHVVFVLHDRDEALVFDEEALHGAWESRGVDPVNIVHLFDEGSLSDDGTDEVEGVG